jgi:hypothetical protein
MRWPGFQHEYSPFFATILEHQGIGHSIAHSTGLKLTFEVQMRDGYPPLVQQKAGGLHPATVRRLFGPMEPLTYVLDLAAPAATIL